jgi:hypothetical protein
MQTILMLSMAVYNGVHASDSGNLTETKSER